MPEIAVLTSSGSYLIRIAAGGVAERIVAIPGRKLFVFDRNCAELFAAQFPGECFVFGQGEADKSMASVVAICQAALEAGLDRSGAMVAVGGGVTGDLTGFASGIYLRGIRCIQVPTTLLAMVDSSVGGKTAADLPEGKNLIGLFHPPCEVEIEPAFLRTLPPRELHCGMAEVIKTAAGFDRAFFEFLEAHRAELGENGAFLPLAPEVIGKCCRIKAGVVSRDEKESGERAKLNFGHTFGHALETLSRFSLSHGEGVAIGMVLASRVALARGTWNPAEAERLTTLIRAAELPTAIPLGMDFDDALTVMRRDKKNRDGRIVMVLPTALGELEIVPDVDEKELRTAWKECVR